MNTTTQTTIDPLTLFHFVPRSQWRALLDGLQGEERPYFAEKIREYNARIDAMPKTYETDGQGENAIVHLHYFSGGGDWYITEKDSDPDQTGQVQAFGLADPFGDGGELGYISILELRRAGVELDLHWTPQPLALLRARR
jgi:hypothetical protein